MKKLFLFFLFIPLAFALQGGETGKIATVYNCIDAYTVKISGNLTIDEGEYRLINCTEVQDNVWECNCTQEDLLMSVKENTVNTYEVIIEYYYLGEAPKPSSGRSSGGGGYFINQSRFTVPFDNNITDEKKEPIKEVPIVSGGEIALLDEILPIGEPEIIDEEIPKDWKPIILRISLVILCVSILLFAYLHFKKRLELKEVEDETGD